MRCIIKEAKSYKIDVGLVEREYSNWQVPRSGMRFEVKLLLKRDMKLEVLDYCLIA